MNQDNIFFNGNNWVIKENVGLDFLNRINPLIDKFCENKIPLKKDQTNTKVLDLSTVGSLSDQYSIRKEIIDKGLLKLLNEYMQICENICKDYCVIEKHKKFSWKVAWTVIGGKGGFHTIHDHKRQDGICSILYLKCRKELMTPFGETYFVLNADCHNNDLINLKKTVTIPPEEGNIILFPSYILHGTYPQTSEMRQSLNVDFEICDNSNSKENFQYS